MLLNELKPLLSLAAYVRCYRIIDFKFPDASVIPPKMYSPRPEQCLQFYPKDREKVSYPGSSSTTSDKEVSLVGLHNILQKRSIGKDFLSLQIVFQPGALYWLTGTAMQELTNQYLDAVDVFGTVVKEINEQLFFAASYDDMILIIEAFLLQLVKRIKKQEHAVDISSRMMLAQTEYFSVDKFLKEAHLCQRQFDRKFNEHLGMAPKQFMRIIRFDKAYRMKNKYPGLDWLSIAIRCGYHDYQHLTKDYKEFTGYTPAKFFEIDNTAPERAFGEAEV